MVTTARNRMIVGTLSAAVAMLAGSASAQWATFEDQSADRLFSGFSVGVGDTQQKAYGWGDLDLDGDVDLVVARKQPFTTAGAAQNVLFMNEGGVLTDRTDEFASASDVPGDLGFNTFTNDRDVLVVDVNGDGWLDVVTAVYALQIGAPKHITHPRIYINLGVDESDAWLGLRHEDARIPALHPTAAPRFYSVSAGDLTGDGAPELFFTDGDAGIPPEFFDFNNRLLVNDGAGFFTDQTGALLAPAVAATSAGTRGAIADMNNDGALDLIRVNAVLPPVHIAIAYADPSAAVPFPALTVVTQATAPTDMSIADLNGDGLLDIIQTDDGTDRVQVNQGPAESGFAQFQANPVQFTAPLGDDGFGGDSVIADFDLDGRPDVVISDVDFDVPGCTRRAHIYRNLGDANGVVLKEEGTPQFIAGINVNSLKGTHDAAAFDVDGDGLTDLILGQCQGTRVFINTTPIAPPSACPADLDESGAVGSPDLNLVLASFGCAGAPACGGDVDRDGDTDSADLNALLAVFGQGCE